MPDETRNHWTDDEDLLARFVLGQLDAGEASSLQRHLNKCTRCSDAVRAESMIAAGLKRAGREELKQRLSRRVVRERSYKFNWYQAAGIAAAIILLVTMAIRYDWLGRTGDQQTEIREKVDSAALPPPQAPSPQAAIERLTIDATKPVASEKEMKPIAGAATEVKGREADEKRIVSMEKGKRADSVPVTLGKGERAPGKKDQPAMSAAAASTEEFWTQGIVMHTVVASRIADKAADLAAEAKGIAVAAREQTIGADSAALSVTQRPLSTLPRIQQARFRTDGVQTLFRQSQQGMQITLFSDTLLTPQELSQARLEPIGSDSLTLIVGQKRIGYRTPPGWLRHQQPPRAR